MTSRGVRRAVTLLIVAASAVLFVVDPSTTAHAAFGYIAAFSLGFCLVTAWADRLDPPVTERDVTRDVTLARAVARVRRRG